MAFDEGVVTRTITAAADLSAKQFFAINAGNVATAAKAIDGILLDNPISGKAGAIAVRGICKACIADSQALTAGVTYLEVASGGKLTALASGIAVAIARETLASVAAARIVAVELLPSNALRT